MSTRYTIPLADTGAALEIVGGKGKSLAAMAAAGLPVPAGFHLTTEAYQVFVAESGLQSVIRDAFADLTEPVTDQFQAASEKIMAAFMDAPVPAQIADALRQAYCSLPGKNPPVAVRSSATAEDLPQASFAGQQASYLNVRGVEAVCDSVRKCWASLWTARAISYRLRQGITNEGISMAVVIQLLVPAEVSGVLFTADPVSGSRSEMIVNASWGLGETVVGGTVTPDTFTLKKTTGEILQREIADKHVQTTAFNGGTREEPVPKDRQKAAALNAAQAGALVQLGNRIEALFETPMDIEWALAGDDFSVVQARPITALPEPEPPVPTAWKLPKGAYAAMRNNIVELMTDPLTPLFKTFGLQAVNTSLDRIMTAFLGDTGVLPDDIIIAVNEYAYYNGSVRFRPMLKILLDTPGIARRMFTGAVARWTETGRPAYVKTVESWAQQPWKTCPSADILNACRELAEAAIDAYGSLVSGLIPAAWMSEAWFTFRYRFIRRKGDPEAAVYLMGFDSLPILAEKALYDLAGWTAEQPELADFFSRTGAQELVSVLENGRSPAGVPDESWTAWAGKFTAYLADYGHMIYNLDFGNPVPADDPGPVLEAFKLFLSGQGTNPHTRQAQTAEKREAAVRKMAGRLKGRRLRVFQKNLARAQKYAPLREDGLADVGLSYPLLRAMLRELGRRLTAAGAIEEPDGVFWLVGEELAEASNRLDNGQPQEDLAGRIPARKAAVRAARRAAPPMSLPQIRLFGRDLMEMKSAGYKNREGNVLKGVAASPGRVTARACVVHGPEDFSRMETGSVLVASLTTPAWTPLFARAAAIVTDIGGPLSHGSIVAREYGIPAVLGTGSATSRILDGQMVTVDGGAGEVQIGSTS